MTQAIWYRLPPRFIQDCLECDCDVGEYSGRHLKATPAQTAELRSRAEHYTRAHGPDACPPGLKTSARALLKAMTALGI